MEGRPILNLTLAINYALSGTRVWSYHATNLLIHILAGLTLFGTVRRTLLRGQASYCDIARRDITIRGLTPWLTLAGSSERVGDNSLHLSLIVALIWTIHPLQTESVTYIVQRAESLMGLFYLLTIYGFIRLSENSAESSFAPQGGAKEDEDAGQWWWGCLSIAACVFGMATKESMASAPIIVLLYDCTFVSGTFAEAWRRRRSYYLGLAASWLVLIGLVIGAGSRGHTVGFGIGITPWDYALTQSQAIIHYLRLCFWPHPLIFDYGVQWVSGLSQVFPCALAVLALLAATVWLLVGRPVGPGGRALGFCGAWFFLILAPTSSVIPGDRQTIAEHRMYLPLAAVVAVFVCASVSLLEKTRRARGEKGPARRSSALRSVGGALAAAAAIACGLLTFQRNEDYRTELTLYRDTVVKRPGNIFAHYNLGTVLAASGLPEEAVTQFEATLRIEPAFPEAEFKLGNALLALGRIGEAANHYEAAIRLNPNYAAAHEALGDALLQLGRRQEARWHYNAAYLVDPSLTEAQRKRDRIEK